MKTFFLAVTMNRHPQCTESDINEEFKRRILRYASERVKSSERRQAGHINNGYEADI